MIGEIYGNCKSLSKSGDLAFRSDLPNGQLFQSLPGTPESIDDRLFIRITNSNSYENFLFCRNGDILIRIETTRKVVSIHKKYLNIQDTIFPTANL